jgi:hypothetical protein
MAPKTRIGDHLMRTKLYVSTVVVALLGLAIWTTHTVGKDSKATVRIWEYKYVEIVGNRPLPDHDAGEPILDRLGSEGWELVSVVPEVHGLTYLAYLKRPK